jgi:hypothetical protein
MHGKITRYLGKIMRYLRLESASRVTAESAVARAVTALARPSLHSLSCFEDLKHNLIPYS